jgi:hypothetical protein
MNIPNLEIIKVSLVFNVIIVNNVYFLYTVGEKDAMPCAREEQQAMMEKVNRKNMTYALFNAHSLYTNPS